MLHLILRYIRTALYNSLLSLTNNIVGSYFAYVSLLLLSAAIISIISNIWQTWHQQQTPSSFVTPYAPPYNHNKHTCSICNHYSTIAKKSLFGTALPQSLNTIPLSTAKIKLKGLIYQRSNSLAAQAIIEFHGKSNIYTIADNITPTSKIILITKQFVLLNTKNHWELLQLN
jgi:hypothetical protein